MEFTLDKLKAECDVDKSHFSILLLDLDHFKTYNDKYGHLFGDDMLRYFSGTLRMSLESLQTLMFRFGGDEFIILLPKTSQDEVEEILSRLRADMKSQYKHMLNLSIGSATSESNQSLYEVMQRADSMMYQEKAQRKNQP